MIVVPAASVGRAPKWCRWLLVWWRRRVDPHAERMDAFIAEHQDKLSRTNAWINRIFP